MASEDIQDLTTGFQQRPPGVPSGRADTLLEEMGRRWQAGERPVVEEFIARHPELQDQADTAVELIYEEICLRQKYRAEQPSSEIYRRFPQWRAQLELLLRCHRLIEPDREEPAFPVAGEVLDEFKLCVELGRGALGRVFLATQQQLADRPVVLKLTPGGGQEHLVLARLQHTHIMPLYSVREDAERNLRILCMPYFGGASLDQLRAGLRGDPPDSGSALVAALDRIQAGLPIALAGKGFGRDLLSRISFVQAVCWIGSCLADALQYAHERGLVHLDIKPSNVLLTADGQPMLLDFHLARGPIRPEDPPPDWLGGTPDYMSPEQRNALDCVRQRQPVKEAVDGRSDVWSLGVLLHGLLGGAVPPANGSRRLTAVNPEVSVGLADIIQRCLAPRPADRYATAAALRADLKNHLQDLPLKGVPNRSWRERWQKWRRRKPHALTLGSLLAAALLALASGGFLYLHNREGQLQEARVARADGEKYLQDRHWSEAADAFQRGLDKLASHAGNDDMKQELAGLLRQARRAQAAQELHELAEQTRYLYDQQPPSQEAVQRLEAQCQAVWQQRRRFLGQLARQASATEQDEIKNDLLDLAIFWANLRVQAASSAERDHAHQEALQVLDEAEALYGPSPVLCHERCLHAEALGRTDLAAAAARQEVSLKPRSAWDHYALGRSLMRTGDLPAAALHFDQALDLMPGCLWAHFYRGVCAHRLGKAEEAVTAFTACLALVPGNAGCFYNRALAWTALGQRERALQDYDRAIEQDPTLAAAVLNRGMLYCEERRYPAAIADLNQALKLGAEPARVWYNLAVVHNACGDQKSALECVQRVLKNDPANASAKDLLKILTGKKQ